ncbi:hypothetical protein JW766_00355 [Candidatus Dojkabacteria bacterium]|nr:hypothetical protein [Candidatus Dojkabacteria bacterium]
METDEQSIPTLSRRDVLKAALSLAAKPAVRQLAAIASAGVGLLSGGVLYLLDSPRFTSPTEVSENGKYAPAFLEQAAKMPFLGFNHGHIPFLKELSLQPFVTDITSEFFIKILEAESPYQLGSLWVEVGDTVASSLQATFPDLPQEMLAEEVLHISTIAMAMLISDKWLTFKEVEELFQYQVPTRQKLQGFGTFFWTQFASKISPVLGRVDRTWHITNHMFLIIEYLYLSKYFPEKSREIPRFVGLLIRGKESPVERAMKISNAASVGYELRTTFRPFSSLRFWSDDVGSGYFDPQVEKDFEANNFAVKIGTSVYQTIDQGGGWDRVGSLLRGLDAL